MKTFLRNGHCPSILAVAIMLFSQFDSHSQNIYSTKANGNWNSPSTWTAGFVPPTGLLTSLTIININHSVTYNSSQDIKNYGTIKLVNTTGTVPVLTIPSGVKFENQSSGKVYITDAEYRQYRFVGGGNSGTTQSGDFINKGGYLEIKNSIVEVAQNFTNDDEGKRIFRKGLLLIGNEYQLINDEAIDTLDKVSVSAGWHGSGGMNISDGMIYFNQAKIQIAGSSSKLDFSAGTGRGDIDYITFKNHVTSTIGSGELKVSSSVSTGGLLNLDAYCVSSAGQYKTNNKFTGSQSFDCSLNYFPSTFMIQQTVNLTAGLGFSAPQAIGTPSLAVGAKYKFALVNDTTDAVVTIDSLINGATVSSIDDNTAGTGYGFAFQPKVSSGNQIGKSYAVFTISFFKTGTNTPVSLQYINATPLDIDGGSALKEFAQISMGTGAGMNYMSASSDISMAQVSPGAYYAQNTAGIERDNIDTSSFNNMFTVYNTDMSSFQIRYGTVKTNTSNSSRQFSLYMKGFAYTPVHTLPVKMASFNAMLVSNKKVDLKWITSTEINVNRFMVERSLDGSTYNEIAMVLAYGNSTSAKNYVFKDDLNSLQAKVVYYRLRTIDEDGKTEYSAVRLIKLSGAEINDLKVLTYPNPVTNEVRVTVPASWQTKQVLYELFSANGQPVKKINTAAASQTETINIDMLAPGFYILRVSCDGVTAQQKIVKQ